MPTNLPPEYFEVEKRYRAAQTPEEKAGLLEQLIATVPKHKGTDKLRADMRERLSRLKAAAQARKKTSRQVSAFVIEKEGAGQVALVGMANVGKSSLVAGLTNARPEVADHPFTTWTPMPGMMPIEDIQVQLIDTPPLNEEYIEPEMINLMRRADMLTLVVDISAYPLEQLDQSIEILEANSIFAEGRGRSVEGGRRVTQKPFLVLVNKCDQQITLEDFKIYCELVGEQWRCVPVSTRTGLGVDEMKRAVYDILGIMRIYSKKPGKEPDLNTPFVMKKGSTIAQFAASIHQDFYRNLKSARVWGSGVFAGQPAGREHVLLDGDIVELRI